MAQVNEFDQAVTAVAQAFLAGDQEAATKNIPKLGDTATEIVANLGTAASRERQVVADETVGMNDALNVTLALQLALGALAIAIGVTAAGTLVISVIRPGAGRASFNQLEEAPNKAVARGKHATASRQREGSRRRSAPGGRGCG